MAHFACSLLSSLKQHYKSTTPTRSRSRGPLAPPLAAYDYGRPHRKAPLQCSAAGKRRYSARLLRSLGTCSTYSSEFPQAQGNGWWNPARVAWVGPGEPDGPNSKKPKSDREKANRTASEIIGRSRASASSDVRRAVGGVAAGTGRWRRAWPAGSHTHTPTRPGGGGTSGGV